MLAGRLESTLEFLSTLPLTSFEFCSRRVCCRGSSFPRKARLDANIRVYRAIRGPLQIIRSTKDFTMSDIYQVTPVTQPICGTVRPPGSKSLTNRALIAAALADGNSRLTGALESDDTRVMIESLVRLGIAITHDTESHTIDVSGCNGSPNAAFAELCLENSGTSIRFLTALCALGNGTFRLDGNARMCERPIGDLVRALKQLGVSGHCESENDCPPVVIEANGLQGGTTTVSGGISSQYLSALLMAAPCAKAPVEIVVEGELVSRPYVDMTLGVMARFGVTADCGTDGRYHIDPQTYRGCEYDIEPDASAASYFFAAAAITGGEVTVSGLNHHALQGDVQFVDALESMGCRVDWNSDSITVQGGDLCGIEVDMNEISDTAQTLSVVAPFAKGPTRIHNIGHVRHKETDRISAVATELKKLGIRVDEGPDELTIHPGPIQPATIATYDDHRMAMSFSLIGLRIAGIKIADSSCAAKTYPAFFDDLESLCQVK